MDCSTPGIPVLYYLLEFSQTISIELMMPSKHLNLYCPLFLLLSTSPTIRIFSKESTLCIRWSNYWNFSFSISIPVDIQCLFPLGLTDLISLHSKGLSRIFSSTTIQKHQLFSNRPSLWSNSHICIWLLEKPWLWLYGLSQQNDVSDF